MRGTISTRTSADADDEADDLLRRETATATLVVETATATLVVVMPPRTTAGRHGSWVGFIEYIYSIYNGVFVLHKEHASLNKKKRTVSFLETCSIDILPIMTRPG